MRRRRPFIEPKRPIFLGCEGRSEVGYGSFLARLAEDADLRVHLEILELTPGAGDPLGRVERAGTRITHLRTRRGTFAHKFILLDGDQRDENPQRTAQAIALAARLGMELIWQEPCHEAMLLRHLPGRAANRPPTTPAACLALAGAWPEYAKPMTRIDLSKKLGLESVLRAAVVEPGLSSLLQAMGLLENH